MRNPKPSNCPRNGCFPDAYPTPPAAAAGGNAGRTIFLLTLMPGRLETPVRAVSPVFERSHFRLFRTGPIRSERVFMTKFFVKASNTFSSWSCGGRGLRLYSGSVHALASWVEQLAWGPRLIWPRSLSKRFLPARKKKFFECLVHHDESILILKPVGDRQHLGGPSGPV